MNRWKTLPLAEACEKITDGTHHSPPIQSVGIPYVTAKHIKADGIDFFSDPWFISENDHRAIFSRCDPRPGDVLYIKDGATTGIAAVNRYAFEFSMLSSVALLRPRSAVLTPEFLCHWLNAPLVKDRILGGMAGVAIRRLTLEKINAIRIPLPPVPEQRRIAEILDKADEIRAKRRAALAKLHSLTQSIFLDMFGDPVTNPKGWPMQSLGAASERITKGESPKWQGFEYQDDGALFVTSENVRLGDIDLSKPKFVPLEFNQKLNRSELRSGDLLVNLVGASIGRSCVFPGFYRPANVNQAVGVVTINRSLIEPAFVAGLLVSPQGQKLLFGNRVEAARANISLTDLRELPIPSPPRELQREYNRRLISAAEQTEIQTRALSELDSLFVSLQHRAFRGEL